ncbi:MAG: hypothetical protein ACI8WB_004930 [Phenylobacterium sp.]|jgi:hypothetical protein
MRYKPPTYLLIGSLILAILPLIPTLIPTLIAGLIANLYNCTLHEGYVNPCIVLGVDLGSTLYSMGLSAWLAIVTIQIGGLGFMVGMTWLIIAFFRNLSARNSRKNG